MEFQIDTFKEKLAEVYVDLEYSFDEFEKILRWIKNNFETTYNKDADLYFGPTQNLHNFQKSFNLPPMCTAHKVKIITSQYE